MIGRTTAGEAAVVRTAHPGPWSLRRREIRRDDIATPAPRTIELTCQLLPLLLFVAAIPLTLDPIAPRCRPQTPRHDSPSAGCGS
jgi:hypothetical protein